MSGEDDVPAEVPANVEDTPACFHQAATFLAFRSSHIPILAQVEAQFATRGITAQRTMFDHIIANLSPEYATEIRDLILRPPGENPYDKVKEQLIKRTAASEQRRLQQLFSTEELGDRRPTQLLRRLQQLAGDTPGLPDGTFLRELFLQRLPANVQMVLASTRDGTPIEDLAQLADKIVEVAIPPSVDTGTNIRNTTTANINCQPY